MAINFVMIYIYASELFPTQLRSLGVGFSIFVGRFGSMICPFMIQLAEYIEISQMVFYGIVGFLALIPIYYLPETFGKKLEDVVIEESQITILSTNWRLCYLIIIYAINLYRTDKKDRYIKWVSIYLLQSWF